MKREALHLPGGISIETGPDWNGRYYVAYRRGVSMFFRDVNKLRKFVDVYAKAARRESLDSWLASLQAADQEKKASKAEPLISEAPIEQTSPSLSQELLATGFGPEVFSDEEDPALSTKMVI